MHHHVETAVAVNVKAKMAIAQVRVETVTVHVDHVAARAAPTGAVAVKAIAPKTSGTTKVVIASAAIINVRISVMTPKAKRVVKIQAGGKKVVSAGAMVDQARALLKTANSRCR